MVQSLTQNDASEANHDMGETRLNLTAPELAWARDMVHGSEILDGQKLGSWGTGSVDWRREAPLSQEHGKRVENTTGGTFGSRRTWLSWFWGQINDESD
jgi:hypothetical protein